MQKYMSHPLHGRMPIYSDSEIAYNGKNGWVLEEDKPALSQKKPDNDVPRGTIEQQYIEKFGKKPHHLAKQETIIAALKE